MNRDLSKLCFWLLANKHSINAVKSKFTVFASPRNMSKLVNKPEIKVPGESLEQVISIDYLGMTMDQYLRWDKHVGALCKKLKSAISSIKIVSYLPANALMNIYHSLVEAKLHYCNAVWGNCNISLKSKLQILQNRAVRVISKNYTLPIEQVFTELKQLIDFDSAALIFKTQNGLAPKYISDMFVPSNYIHGHNIRHAMNGLFNCMLAPLTAADVSHRLEADCGIKYLITHFYRIREEGDSGRPLTVYLRTDDVTQTYYTSF